MWSVQPLKAIEGSYYEVPTLEGREDPYFQLKFEPLVPRYLLKALLIAIEKRDVIAN